MKPTLNNLLEKSIEDVKNGKLSYFDLTINILIEKCGKVVKNQLKNSDIIENKFKDFVLALEEKSDNLKNEASSCEDISKIVVRDEEIRTEVDRVYEPQPKHEEFNF